jgi:hypothetical protein
VDDVVLLLLGLFFQCEEIILGIVIQSNIEIRPWRYQSTSESDEVVHRIPALRVHPQIDSALKMTVDLVGPLQFSCSDVVGHE